MKLVPGATTRSPELSRTIRSCISCREDSREVDCVGLDTYPVCFSCGEARIDRSGTSPISDREIACIYSECSRDIRSCINRNEGERSHRTDRAIEDLENLCKGRSRKRRYRLLQCLHLRFD